MLEVREAYLTRKQMEHIGAKTDNAALVPNMDQRRQRAGDAAKKCVKLLISLFIQKKTGSLPPITLQAGR